MVSEPLLKRTDLLPLAHEELARRAAQASIFPFLLLLVAGAFTPLFREHPSLSAGFTLLLAGAGSLRISWSLSFRIRYPAAPALWLRWFRIGAFSVAVTWAAFTICVLLMYGEAWTVWFVLMLTAGLAAGASISLAPDVFTQRSYMILLLAPAGTYAVLRGTESGVAFTLAIAAFLAFLMVQGEIQASHFWQSLADQARLREQAEELQRRSAYLDALVQNSPLAIVSLDEAGHIRLCNPAFEHLFQHTAAEVLGKRLDEYFPSSETEAAELTKRVLQGEAVHVTARRQRKDGSEVDVEIHAVPLMLEGRRVGLHALYEDITERKRAEAELLAAREVLRDQSLRDVLTGVWNRRGILDILNAELARTQRTGVPLAVLLLDLDHFKRINDTHGHAGGDETLRETTRRLSVAVRASDFLGRYGGEEFIVVAPACDEQGARHLAERIGNALRDELIMLPTGGIHVTLSAGVAIATSQVPAEELIHEADQALYRAKAAGRDCFELAVPQAPRAT